MYGILSALLGHEGTSPSPGGLVWTDCWAPLEFLIWQECGGGVGDFAPPTSQTMLVFLDLGLYIENC